MIEKKLLERFRVEPGTRVRLKDHDPGDLGGKKHRKLGKDGLKKKALALLEQNRQELAEVQNLLYANDVYSILIILQAMDAAGKDGIIKHVMSGINPQGCQVYSFKQPSAEELDHNFLWRCSKCLPERGRIGIFNRSYYEEVLVVKVHPQFLDKQQLPPGKRNEKFWEARYDDINNFERHLVRNGTVVLKFFLHISKAEQKRRFLERLDTPEKYWKFSPSDMAERAYWDDYQRAFEEALSATSTAWAPWHVIPSDRKWVARTLVAEIICDAIRGLDLSYPKVSKDRMKALAAARKALAQ
jgi:PPK2 family polyphosphate:nucleotide phosphotransferase